MEKYSGIVILVLIDVLTQRFSDHKWKNILVQSIIILVLIDIWTQRYSDHKWKNILVQSIIILALIIQNRCHLRRRATANVLANLR